MTFPKLDIKNSHDLNLAKLTLKGYIHAKEAENSSPLLDNGILRSDMAKTVGLFALKYLLKKFRK